MTYAKNSVFLFYRFQKLFASVSAAVTSDEMRSEIVVTSPNAVTKRMTLKATMAPVSMTQSTVTAPESSSRKCLIELNSIITCHAGGPEPVHGRLAKDYPNFAFSLLRHPINGMYWSKLGPLPSRYRLHFVEEPRSVRARHRLILKRNRFVLPS